MDVVFVEILEPETTPPNVTAVSPVNGAVGVSIDTKVTVTFSEAMNAATVNGSTISLQQGVNRGGHRNLR